MICSQSFKHTNTDRILKIDRLVARAKGRTIPHAAECLQCKRLAGHAHELSKIATSATGQAPENLQASGSCDLNKINFETITKQLSDKNNILMEGPAAKA